MSKGKGGTGRTLASQSSGESAADAAELEKLCQIVDLLENPTLIQADAFQLACVKNDEGEITGIVSACKKVDSDGNVTGWTYFLHESGQPAVEYTGDWEACADLQDLIDSICEKFDILNSTVCPQPPCASTDPELAAVTYTNSDNATEMDVSIGGNGDIKINSGGGDASDAEITAYIESCLAAGHDVELSMSGVDGDTASATLLAAATTNAFPGFYNQSVNATATLSQSFKVNTMTATCLQTAEEAGSTQKTYDQCAVALLEEITELLACPPATARGVLTSW